jgi:antitoxin YefM
MRPLKLDEDIRPLSEFRAEVASFVKRINDTQRPLVLTQRGRGVVVVVDIAEYAAMRERLETIDDIAAARVELAAGAGVSHEAARAQVLSRLRG